MKSNKLDYFCLGCPHLNGLCEGNFNDVYSGCVWKAADAESFGKFLDRTNGQDAADKLKTEVNGGENIVGK